MKLDVVSGLNQMSRVEVAEMYEHLNIIEGVTLRQQFNAMYKIGKSVGIPLTNEQLLFVCVNSCNVLSDAGPGSGKSTCSIFALLHAHYFRKISMQACLVILYTRQAAEDYNKKVRSIIDRLNKSGIPNLRVDGYPDVYTIHKLARMWVKEYCYDFGYDSHSFESALLDDVQSVFEKILVENYETLYYMLSGYELKQIVSFYNYLIESSIVLSEMSEDELFKNRYYPTKRISKQQLMEIYELYDDYKLIQNKMDFTDFIMTFHSLLTKNPEMLERIRTVYDFFLSDGYQDQSPLFVEIISILAGDTNLLKAMGDSDQTLFNFRGIETYNMLDFKKHYTNSVVTTLSYNMRCPAKVVDMSNKLISTNKHRYEKNLYGIEKPHHIELCEVNNKYDIINKLLEVIKATPPNEHGEIGVLYRNVRSAGLLSTYLLLKTNYSFIVHSGLRPFSDLLSRSILPLLNIPFNEGKRDFLRKLYYYTPLTKEQSLQVYEQFKNLNEYRSSFIAENKITRALDTLLTYMERARNYEPAGEIMRPVVNNIYLYFINFINDRIIEAGEQVDSELYQLIEEFFLRPDKTVHQVALIATEYINKMSNADRKEGIQLSTIHSAKGTEYNKVIILDLNQNFPNVRHKQNLPESQQESFIEEEVRVLYVGMTRTKKELYVFNDGSAFADVFRENGYTTTTNFMDTIRLQAQAPSANSVVEADIPEVALPGATIFDKLLSGYKQRNKEANYSDDVLEVTLDV